MTGSSNSFKRNFIIFISLAIIFLFKLIPAPTGLPQAGMEVLGIFIGCLILWLTISIDWPSFLCIGLLGLMPMLGFNNVLASSFGNSTFAFLMFTFICTYALSETPFLRRCALFFITSPIAKKGSWHFVILFFFSVIFVGSFISPTVLFVIFLPILEEIYNVLKLKKGDKIAEMLMMGLAFCTSISSGMTPIAHVFSLMAMGYYKAATGRSIDYASYMAFAVPVGLISLIFMILIFKLIYRPDMSYIQNIDISLLKADNKPMDHKEKSILTIFAIVVGLWIIPGLIKPIFPSIAAKIDFYGTAMPPLFGAIALSVLTFEGKPLLNFKNAMSKGVPWGSLIMAAATLTFGTAMTNEKIGLTKYLSNSLGPAVSNMAPWLLVLLFTLWAAVQTNLSSNMVTVTTVCTIGIPIVLSTNGAVNTAAVASIIGMMSSYAFATPPAMPHIAIAGSSGWAHASQLLKYGTLLMIITVIITVIIGYPIASALM